MFAVTRSSRNTRRKQTGRGCISGRSLLRLESSLTWSTYATMWERSRGDRAAFLGLLEQGARDKAANGGGPGALRPRARGLGERLGVGCVGPPVTLFFFFGWSGRERAALLGYVV